MKKTLMLLVCLAALSCVDNRNKTVEEIRFLMDAQNYTDAVDKSRQYLSTDPDDEEVKFLLASSLLGQATLTGGSGCQEGDDGVLGLLACVIRAQDENQSAFETFGRIAPDESLIDELEEATDLLDELETDLTDPVLLQQVYLKRFVSKNFEIAAVFTKIGANSTNTKCNACEAPQDIDAITDAAVCAARVGGTGIDDVSDDFVASALSTEEENRFINNLNTISSDGEAAGLGADFDTFSRVAQILQDIEDEGGDIPVFFEVTFGGTKRECNQTP